MISNAVSATNYALSLSVEVVEDKPSRDAGLKAERAIMTASKRASEPKHDNSKHDQSAHIMIYYLLEIARLPHLEHHLWATMEASKAREEGLLHSPEI